MGGGHTSTYFYASKLMCIVYICMLIYVFSKSMCIVYIFMSLYVYSPYMNVNLCAQSTYVYQSMYLERPPPRLERTQDHVLHPPLPK